MTGVRARCIGGLACIVSAAGCGEVAGNGAPVGAVEARADAAPFDAGPPPADGAAPFDAGLPPADSAAPFDAGLVPAESGTPFDAGLASGCSGLGDASAATIAVSVAVGANTACALTQAGAVLCWGSNTYGLLGTGSTADSAVPVPVTGLESGVTAISMASATACALTMQGAVLCWGSNDYGALGNNSGAVFSAVPAPVTGLYTGAIAVSVGAASAGGGTFACAINAAGGVVCWGANTESELGSGSIEPLSRVPLPVMGLASGVTAISAGAGAACAITEGGAVQCWGNSEYFSPDSGAPYVAIPTTATGLPAGVTAVSVGQGSACALMAGGQVRCLGSISQGFVQGPAGSVPVAGLSSGVTVVSVAQTEDSACALNVGGMVSCWGLESAASAYPPLPLAGLESGVTAISVNASASCAVTASGGVDCWGTGGVAQPAIEEGSGAPTPVAGFGCPPSGPTNGGASADGGSSVAPACADPLTFADPDVESVVRGAIGLATGPILNANVADLTDLNLIFSDRPNLPPTPPYTSPPTDIDYVDPPKADGIVTSLGGVECLSNLRTIDLDPYLVDLTPLGRLANLTELDFTQTFETAFPPLPSATSLTASLLYNTAAGLSACPNLRVLNLTSPDFSTAGARSSLAALTGLTTLSLQGGNLTDTAPLASLPLLTDVELASNQIQDISSLSAGFANLRSLDLSDNPITDLAPLVANGNLGYGAAIAITGVSIDCTAQGPNIAALRARGVTLVTDCP